jgi:HSP20 family protein
MAEQSQPQGQTATIEKREERALRRWDPFELLAEIEQDMARLWSEAWPLAPRPFRRLFRAMPRAMAWSPRVDMFQRDGDLIVKAELPGIKKDDIEVTVEDGDLVIRGERKEESEVREEDYYRMERSYGAFYRRLPLPAEVDPDKIKATYTDGVLEVRVPQVVAPKREAKKIPVS